MVEEVIIKWLEWYGAEQGSWCGGQPGGWQGGSQRCQRVGGLEVLVIYGESADKYRCCPKMFSCQKSLKVHMVTTYWRKAFCILNWGKWVRWLVINEVHICYIRKDRGTKKTSTWECSGRRRLGCEFKMRTTKPESPGALTIIQIIATTCSADKVAPLQCIDAKVSYMQLAKRMKEDSDVRWSKIGMGNVYWNIV